MSGDDSINRQVARALWSALAGTHAQDFAVSEATKLVTTLANIEKLRSEGKITAEQAAALLDMQKHATQAVFLTAEGVSLIKAQVAINQALDAIKGAVEKAIGAAL